MIELLAWLLAFLSGIQAWAQPDQVAQRAVAAETWPAGTEVTVASASPDGNRLGWTSETGDVVVYVEDHVRAFGPSYTALVREFERTVEHEAHHAWCLDRGGQPGHQGTEPVCY